MIRLAAVSAVRRAARPVTILALLAAVGCGSVSTKQGTGGAGGQAGDDAGGVGGGSPADGGGDAAAPLTIKSTIPPAASTGVSVTTTITIQFSAPMNQSSVTVTLAPAAALAAAPVWNGAGDTVTFTPQASLTAATAYTATVAGQDLGGRSLSGTATFTFTTGTPDTAAPTVVSTSPAAGATGVATGAMLSVTFSEPMDTGTVTLTIDPPVELTDPTFNGTATVATVTGPLSPATSYTVSIAGADLAGNVLGGTIKTFQFTTAQPPDTVAPTVVSTVPGTGATNVASASTIAISFSEPMNQALTAAAIATTPAVVCLGGGWTWNAQGTFASCQPSTPLTAAASYSVTIGTGARDLAGNALAAAFVFTFMTAAAPDVTPPTITSVVPAAGADGVALTSNIVVNFSEPMNLASAQTAFQVLAPVGVTGTFTWSNGGATLTFNPAANFANGTLVQFQVNMAAQDAAGNPKAVVNNYSFTTMRRGTVTIYSDAAADGYLNSLPTANTTSTLIQVGDDANNLYYNGYLTFTLALPGVTAANEPRTSIVSATLSANQLVALPAAYTSLGSVVADHVDFGPTLTTADLTTPTLVHLGATATLSVDTVAGAKSVAVSLSVINDWTNRVARAKRSQFRLRFTQNTDIDDLADFAYFDSGEFATITSRPRLTVTYDYP